MTKASPLQEVRERFETKTELAKQLYDKLEKVYVDETDEEFQRRIRTMSNKKLLRLYDVVETVESKFGDKAGLIDAIMKLRYAGVNPDEQYREKLERQHLTRLLDEHRSLERRQARA